MNNASQDKTFVRSQVIPTKTGTMILPNKCIAEIVKYTGVKRKDGSPNWLIGNMSWRDRHIPIVGIESLSNESREIPSGNTWVLVMNSISKPLGLDFYGIVTSGVPHLIRLNESILSDNIREVLKYRYMKMNVLIEQQIDGELKSSKAYIPDVDYIESAIAECDPKYLK